MTLGVTARECLWEQLLEICDCVCALSPFELCEYRYIR